GTGSISCRCIASRTSARTATRSAVVFCRPCRCRDECGGPASSRSTPRVSTIEDVSEKTGRTGRLVFVKVRHEIRRGDERDAALVEHHDIVYRDAPVPGDVVPPPKPAPSSAAWERKWIPDDVLLFRYSALTFTGHR